MAAVIDIGDKLKLAGSFVPVTPGDDYPTQVVVTTTCTGTTTTSTQTVVPNPTTGAWTTTWTPTKGGIWAIRAEAFVGSEKVAAEEINLTVRYSNA